jgi:hypothetical protein
LKGRGANANNKGRDKDAMKALKAFIILLNHGFKDGLGFIGKFQRCFDLTSGCIAMTNEEADELYKSVPIGTKIEIF